MNAATCERRNAEKEIASATRRILVEKFPLCFMPLHAEKKPLKVGIYGDIRRAAPDIPVRNLNLAMRDCTRGPKYLRAVVVGADRIGLDGEPVAKVSETQAAHAAAKLAELEARWARQREARATALLEATA